MRPAPALAPEDSLERFLHTIRFLPVTALPVVRAGRLVGMAHIEDALPLLAGETEAGRSEALQRPVAVIVRPPTAVIHPDMTPEEAGRLCAAHGAALLPVMDDAGYCLGVVVAGDLFAPELPPAPPPRLGGMATPFGVYLTDGTHQAGAGNLGLFASGAAIAVLMIVTIGLVEGGLWLARHYGLLPPHTFVRLDSDTSQLSPMLGLAALGLRGVALIVFLSLLRVTRVAGYHAAEHQTVHALERGERLTPEIVGRMPRPHPRCGTNLMAAGILFTTFWQLLTYVPILNESPYLFSAVVTAFLWRPFGSFLQEWFTTRPASPRELASGIQAGEELMHKYLNSPPMRPRLLRRLWNMGLLQTLTGMLLTLYVLQLIPLVGSFLS
jgi:CBS domain-containing protein